MANLSAMMDEWAELSPEEIIPWVRGNLQKNLSEVSKLMEGANVLMYFSAFLQQPKSKDTSMEGEDINGIMSALHGMDFEKNLAVILHTPGGDVRAAEQIISYIHSKFKKVTAIVPVISMSAGSMFALSCDEIIISRAGQLGPTDPQIRTPQGFFSVKDVIDQFDLARHSIIKNPTEAHVWAPILQSYSPALHRYATRVEAYANTKIREWLKKKGKNDTQVESILKVFHEKPHFHGERIDYEVLSDKSIDMNLQVSLLEDNQNLQNAVLQAYHTATLFAGTTMTKMIINDSGNAWLKVIPQPNYSS